MTAARPIPVELMAETNRRWERDGGTPSQMLVETLDRHADVALTLLPAVHVLALRQAANLFIRRDGSDSPVAEAIAHLAQEVEDSARTGETILTPPIDVERWVEAFLTADPQHRSTLAAALTSDADYPPHEATLKLVEQRMRDFAEGDPDTYFDAAPIEALDMVIGGIRADAQHS